MTALRIGIVGYGNLGRGVEIAVSLQEDMELVGVFTRRAPSTVSAVHEQTIVRSMDALETMQDEVDVLVLCGGSKTDLPEQTPLLAEHFTVVDSFDTHARIPEHFARVDAAANAAGTTALISTGWDPGLFSINRVYGEAILATGSTYTFWGRGLSQGHSDALRRLDGVADAVQYTIPSQEAIARVRAGDRPELSTREKHTRECFVALEDGADADAVREEIVTMPHYFEPFETSVTFLSAEELARDHQGMPHGGFVIRAGESSPGTTQTIEYRLQEDSNPEFTASVLVAYARAAGRLAAAGEHGAKTPFDVAPGLLSPKSPEQLRADDL
ncbi:MAG: diaminopimelate dehydrogenase [Brachybacterium tyrofermentans]|uniref:diaminopimelate dehydrogenase n=1 Tax=Brachybacterium tyrofermentans TaxID=47848 RepID=UPI000A1AB31F|nr:diaminopimelate dehydrogenase [Brachybacterium tyrofermentans]SLM99235.1 Meso-diaminopimelate D-dehydrogenase [Corynebacterium xerosis]